MTKTLHLPRLQCPLCDQHIDSDLRWHIAETHGREALRQAVLAAKEEGMSDSEIGQRYGISFGTLEQMLTESYGANVALVKRPRRISRWQPANFRPETSSVWSFKQRGDWATHSGHYRGNWSPYIPRNVILRYSRPGDTVLDYFVGGGTTAVEAKLLGRRCIARDINPGAIEITLENLAFSPPGELLGKNTLYEPEVRVGDARDLSDIPSDSIDLICAHPPYGGIVKYSTGVEGDLSNLTVEDFLLGMRQVARESLRVLKPGGKCVILIGDGRKSKHVVPIGFETIRVFRDAGFVLRELVIKRQHNCRTTGFWYTRSIQYNFMLLAHEYLPVFEKPLGERIGEPRPLWATALSSQAVSHRFSLVEEEKLETTTVWIFPQDRLESEVRRNLALRFAGGAEFLEIRFGDGGAEKPDQIASRSPRSLHIRPPEQITEETLEGYRAAVKGIITQSRSVLPAGSFVVVEARDFYAPAGLVPAGLLLWQDMADQDHFALKEIVIVAPLEMPEQGLKGPLTIAHSYLLVYRKKD